MTIISSQQFIDPEIVEEKMKDILQTIILNLVENKEEVQVNENINEDIVTFEVKVSKEDMGKVIGKQGRIAKAIRTVMKSVAAKENKKVSVDFIEN